MKSIFKVELDRAFRNKLFGLVVVIGCAMALLDFFTTNSFVLAKKWYECVNDAELMRMESQYNTHTSTTLQLWMPNRGTGGKFYYLLYTIMPLLAVIPYGASYINDKKGGLVNQFVTRVKKKYYYLAKFLTAFLSGGTIAVIPLVFNLVVCMCSVPWGNPIYATHLYPVSGKSVFGELYYEHPEVYVLLYLVYTFIVFGLLNCLCLSFTYIDDNIFMVLLSPFIFYYVTNVVMSYVFGESKYSLMFNANMIYFYKDIVWVVAIQLVLLLVVNLTFLLKSKKDVI